MKSLISVVLLISVACGGLFYLYSEDGPIQNLEKQDNAKKEAKKEATK